MQDSYHFWDEQAQEDLWWSPYVRDFRQISPFLEPIVSINASTAQDTPKIGWAALCRAPSINVPQYLLYLQEKGRLHGVQLIKHQLSSEGGLEKALKAAESRALLHQGTEVDLFVNATGLGAAKLCADNSMYPVRGQTVLVRGEALATRTRHGHGYLSYCIPRPGSGTTILGGTKEVGSWKHEIDEASTERILQKAKALAPELLTGPGSQFEVVSVQCGLRPGRQGGPRMETEVVGGSKVVHAYGMAGGGYQNSIGAARMVVNLVDESLAERRLEAKL